MTVSNSEFTIHFILKKRKNKTLNLIPIFDKINSTKMIRTYPNVYKNISIFLLLTSLLLNTSCKTSKNNSSKWETIFNGVNLNGWTIEGIDNYTSNNFWKINNQYIQCITNGNRNHSGSWLVYNKELEDFELKFKFKSNHSLQGNSGVQLRSSLDLSNNKMQGPQIDIHPPKPFRTGLLYDETDGVKHWLFPLTKSWRLEDYPLKKDWNYDQNGWNELYIKCIGTKIITELNGITITNYNGKGVLDDTLHQEKGVGLKGLIAFQLHKKHDIDIAFKDIQLKILK